MIPDDPWGEPRTEFHEKWLSAFPKSWRDRSIERDGATHVADVVALGGRSIIVRSGLLTSAEIRERESFFGPQLTWIWDASTWPLRLWPYRDCRTLKLCGEARAVWVCVSQLWDVGTFLFRPQKIYTVAWAGPPRREGDGLLGWGHEFSRSDALQSLIKGKKLPPRLGGVG